MQRTETQSKSRARETHGTVVVTRTVDVGTRRRRVAQQRAPHVDPICPGDHRGSHMRVFLQKAM